MNVSREPEPFVQQEDRGLRLAKSPETLEELETRLREAVRSIEAGEGVDGPETMRRLIARYQPGSA